MKQRLHLFFLDGERRYSETLSASETWWPKLRDSGLLVGDDYSHPDDPRVQQAPDELARRYGLTVRTGADRLSWYKV